MLATRSATRPLSTAHAANRTAAPRRRAAAAVAGSERKLALLEMRAAVAAAANEHATAAGALRAALAELCNRLGRPVGRAIVLDGDARALKVLWHGRGPGHAAFREASDAVAPSDARGVAGRALAAGAAVWVADAGEDLSLATWRAARQAGLRSALAFPVAASGRVAAVVEAWGEAPEPVDAAVLEACAFAARQLSAAFEREAGRAEAAALRAVVAAAPAGAVAFGSDGRAALWTGAAQAMLGGAPAEGGDGWTGASEAAGRTVRTRRRATTLLRTGDGAALKLRLAPVTLADDEHGAAGWVSRPRPADAPTQQVLATVAHDLRSPLNGITLAADALLRGMDGEAPDRALVACIAESASRMCALVGDMLECARLGAGALPVSPAPVRLDALLRDAVHAQRLQAKAAGVALEIGESCGCVVSADERRIAQVLQNLVGNALAHTPAGGRVTISAGRGCGEVRVAVADTGRGIPAAELPHVFDRFWRGTRACGGGAGLGLSIARAIVEAHGGAISAASTPGLGTTMTFTLPLAQIARAA